MNASLEKYEQAYARIAASNVSLPAESQRQINQMIQRMEQSLTDAKGLPGREWYHHYIYAPGQLTGYRVKTLPTEREALEARRWDGANTYAKNTA